MAVSVAQNMTLVDDADQTAGWTSTLGGLAQATLSPREATTYLADQASEGSFAIYHTIASTDLSAHTIFSWMRNSGPNTTANGGMRILLGDGTDRIAYYVGGSDDFGHFVLGWSMFKLDTTILPANFEVLTGVEANLTTTALVDVGMGGEFPGKAAGNADNVFVDILRYIANGSAALTVTGGTTGDRGTWAEVVVTDVSTSADAAFGIIRTLVTGSKAYELNYGVEFGAASGDTFFDDSDFQLILAGTDMAAGNMDVDLIAGTGTNLFSLNNFVVVGVGTVSNWDLSAAMETMSLTDGQFVDCGTFVLPPAGGTLRECLRCIFTRCGAITTDTIDFNDCKVLTSTAAADTSAIVFNVNSDPDGELDNIEVTIGTNAHHAIEFGTASPLTITLRGWTATGFNASDAQNDSTFHVLRTSGTVTINVIGGTGNFSFKTAGATVDVVIDPVTALVNVKDNTGANLQNARVIMEASDDTADLPFENSVTITRSGTVATVAHTAHGLNTSDKVKIKGITDKIEDNNGVQTIVTVPGANSYTYTTTDSGSTSYTGTIIATGVVFEGDTDASGNISRSRTYTVDQPITGRARFSTISPRLKTFDLAGTIDNTDGLIINIQMIIDE